MSETLQRLLPSLADPDTAGFFEAAGRGELVVRACNSCGHVIHLPRAVCDRCLSWDTAWRPVRPRGKIYTFSVVERQVHPLFPAPFTLILVELDDAPSARLMGRLDGAPNVGIGMAVEAEFQPVDGTALLTWRLTGD